MKVAVTGGTGWVGPAVVQAFLDAGHEVAVLEHRKPVPVPDTPRLRRVKGDVLDAASLARLVEGADAVAHLVAIRRAVPKKGITFERMHTEATRNVVDAAKAAGARRFLLMSAIGVDEGTTPYFRTKREMERMVKESGLDWTIMRPSYVSGPSTPDAPAGGESVEMEFSRIVDRAPALPSFGGGDFVIQPIAREDVALAFARALERPEAVGRTFELVGPDRMTWNEYMRALSRLRGKRRALLPAPMWLVLPAVRMLGPLAPASADELLMLTEGSVGDPGPLERDLGVHPMPWEQAVAGLRVGH